MLPSASDCVEIHFPADLQSYGLKHLSTLSSGELAANGRIPSVNDMLDLNIVLDNAYTVRSD